jgi:23S rRNA (cytosine1962-C5)-methyltransferase
LADGSTDTCRLIFSESDYLPGLIVDKYADHLAVQVLTSGMQNAMPVIIDELNSPAETLQVYLIKAMLPPGQHEGLETTNVLLAGTEPPELVMVKENGITYGINIAEGQKSGFYCDQRYNRELLASYAKGKKVLDCFCYTGGFTLNAMQKRRSISNQCR